MRALNAPHGFSQRSSTEIVTTAASAVPVERRSVFLERRGAMLRMRWQIQRFM
jgi:hypothetical protein